MVCLSSLGDITEQEGRATPVLSPLAKGLRQRKKRKNEVELALT